MKGSLRFYSILDFYPRKEKIKEEYDKLSIEEKQLYKKEVYSMCFEREYVKDLIWEYLNNWEESRLNLDKEWKIKKKKTEQKYESNYTNEIRQLE